eukprot:TRINITY_DN41370_c0_g3_i1.p3 TRINITY_DN41370_c0_g3~~TRINITY_DN41370_c0_g3_i1.p3  ORF type:complete len:389 (+),score=126.77 TRINITY_DN41370_c0_g3_i1:147-1169(+)
MWQQALLCQGLVMRLRGAEAALGREAAGRKHAEWALAAERRETRRLLGELRDAEQRAAVAGELCRELAAELASAARAQRVDEADSELTPPAAQAAVPAPECGEGPAGAEVAPPPGLTEQPAEQVVAEPELPPPEEPAAAAEPPAAAEGTEGEQQAAAPPSAPPSAGAVLRARLRAWCNEIPIGGNPASTSRRVYEVEPLAEYAEANGMQESSPEEIYEAHTLSKLKQGEAAAAGGAESGPNGEPPALLQPPSPRDAMPRRLGLPQSRSSGSDDDWTVVDAPTSPPPVAPPGGGPRGWLSQLPGLPAAVGQVAAVAAGALAGAGQRGAALAAAARRVGSDV